MNNNNNIIVLTAVWHLLFGVYSLVTGIRCFIEGNTKSGWIITQIGIVPTLAALYLLWGRYRIIKYFALSYCIVNSVVWGAMILTPNSFSFLGSLCYTLYYVLGIVFSAISISIIRRS